MSYSIYLGSEASHLPNPTYNLTPIFDLALTGESLPNPELSEAQVVLFRKQTDRPRGLRLLSGKKAATTSEWLEKALVNMKSPENRERFLALEPDNGWGDLSGAIEVIERLLEVSREYPEELWEVY